MRAAVLAFALALLPLTATGHEGLVASDAASLAVTPHPGARLPLEASLADEAGRRTALGQYFRGQPVILVVDYLGCRTLCSEVLDNLAAALERLPLAARRDVPVTVVSVDPRDTPTVAAQAKERLLRRHPGMSASGWHFLTNAASGAEIADAVGFPFRYNPRSDEYVHPAGLVIAAPDGTVAGYLSGIDIVPADLGKAITAAADGAPATPLRQFLVFCFGGEGHPGRYSAVIEGGLLLVNLSGIAGLVAIFARLYRR
ncbi:MAG TPA: SCO family protein, partial [Stellaceae bacterium]|nr:SCO family protein [Stellaceae bacterium]